jgi:hypothetical protein
MAPISTSRTLRRQSRHACTGLKHHATRLAQLFGNLLADGPWWVWLCCSDAQRQGVSLSLPFTAACVKHACSAVSLPVCVCGGGGRLQHGPPPHQLTCHCPASASCCCPTAVAHSGVVWCVQVWGRSRHQHDTRGDEQHAGPALLSETMPGIDATATHTLMKTCTGSQQAAAAAAEARGVRRAWQRHSAAAGSQVNHSSRLASL